MNDDEVEGVLGHEVTHIANGDMVTMTLLQGVINAFVMFFARLIAYVIANRGDSRERGYSGGSFLVVIVLQIVLGILGSLITAWFSRQREFRADRGGAMLAGRERMIGALRRLAANRERSIRSSRRWRRSRSMARGTGWCFSPLIRRSKYASRRSEKI